MLGNAADNTIALGIRKHPQIEGTKMGSPLGGLDLMKRMVFLRAQDASGDQVSHAKPAGRGGPTQFVHILFGIHVGVGQN